MPPLAWPVGSGRDSPRARRTQEAKPVAADAIKVELQKPDIAPLPEKLLTPDQPLPLTDAPPAAPGAPPPLAIPDSPAPVAVAAPGRALAFAVPVEGYTRLVDVSQATHGRPVRIATTTTGTGNASIAAPPPPRIAPPVIAATVPVVRHLTLGEGEGRQPAPEYPREAIMARQEGTVTLRFSVDETGRVTNVETASPCRWPLLNQAAVRTVRERWHFSPGPPRTYEVPIEFQFEK